MVEVGQLAELIILGKCKEITPIRQEGIIESINKDFIVIKLKNYKTCLNKTDLIENRGFKLKVKQNDRWIDVRKEILKDTKLPNKPKARNIYKHHKKKKRGIR